MKPHATSTATPVRPSHEELTEILQSLTAEHETLLALAKEHRAAISRADAGAMQTALEKQNETLARVRALELRRQACARSISGPKPITVSAIAARLADPARSRLAAAAERLREVLNTLHREHAAIREAAETLSSHMEGLMRQVCRKVSHAGTYGPSAAIDLRHPVISALDVRT